MKTLHALSRTSEEYRNTGFISEDEVSEDGLFVSEEEYWENYYNHPDFNYEFLFPKRNTGKTTTIILISIMSGTTDIWRKNL